MLPEDFADLEPLLPRWGATGMAERLRLRLESTAEERLRFYSAMQPRAEAIMAHLQKFRLEELPPASERLLQLMLVLAEISLTEEVLGQAIEPVHAKGNRVMRVEKELDGR